MLTPPVPCTLSALPLWLKSRRVAYGEPYIATGKVTALEHEVRDDAVEARTRIGKLLAVLGHEAFAKLAKVLGSYGSDVIVEVEVDPASLV